MQTRQNIHNPLDLEQEMSDFEFNLAVETTVKTRENSYGPNLFHHLHAPNISPEIENSLM